VAHAQQPGAEKLVKVAVGGKLHRRGRRPISHMNCKETCWPEKVGAVSPPPVCLEREKLVAVAVLPRRTLSKQSLRD
jgi:hypothetical protein